jgi:hypothetical protein
MNKRELTKKFLEELSLDTSTKSIRQYHTLWWMNPRTSKSNGFRLTERGFEMMMVNLQLTHYDVVFPEEIEWDSRLILRLDKHLDSPYFINRKSITVFKEKTAIELILFGGDVQKYGLAKERSKQKSLDKDA